MSDKVKTEKPRTAFPRACSTRCLVCVVASLLSVTIWAENPYAASGVKSTSFASRAYQEVMKSLGMDKSKPPMSSFGNGPAFDINNGKVVNDSMNSKDYKDFMRAREEDYPEHEYKIDLDKDVLSEENWPYDQLTRRTPEEIVNMAKSRAMNALEDRIGIRYKIGRAHV